MRINRKYMLTAIMLMLLAVAGCDRLKHWFGKENTNQGFVKEIPAGADGNSNQVAMLLPDFTQLVDQQGPAVVNIQATRDNRNIDGDSEISSDALPDNDPFYEYFKYLLPKVPQTPQANDDEFNFGSGFIISKDGYILTNTHVVNGMNNIKVLLNDKREFQAKLIGADTQSDVALLKISANGLPVVQPGNPKDLKVGEWVAAIGAPFGFDNSVTAGIVSAKGRSLPEENYTPFIQTDVAINPGNSGGPLFNLKGQVVGINSQIYSRSGGFMGISFAIPIDVAMNVAEQLKTTGKVQRGRLGVVIQEVNYNLAKSFGLDKANGALITQVVAGGPAAKAGLLIGDIVESVNGEQLDNSSDLPVRVGLLQPGKQIVLGIWRKGKKEEIKVVLDNMSPAITNPSTPASAVTPTDGTNFTEQNLGLTLQATTKGLVIEEVSGLAAQVDLRRGDIIVAVGQKLVHDENDFEQAVAASGKSVPLLIRRASNTLFVALMLP
ncbi:protease Do [Snodgrassella alvi]|nr:DegQ family serine endoprotease [Snodgrassella alvi]PIT16536.1 protease Do [Snodgrassella alvi]PIT18349.1 protease Do [Snodgrassella alvi]